MAVSFWLGLDDPDEVVSSMDELGDPAGGRLVLDVLAGQEVLEGVPPAGRVVGPSGRGYEKVLGRRGAGSWAIEAKDRPASRPRAR